MMGRTREVRGPGRVVPQMLTIVSKYQLRQFLFVCPTHVVIGEAESC